MKIKIPEDGNFKIKADIELKAGVNILAGENGSGKTLFAKQIAKWMTKNKGKQVESLVQHHWFVKGEKESVKNLRYLSALSLANFENYLFNIFSGPDVLWKELKQIVKKHNDFLTTKSRISPNWTLNLSERDPGISSNWVLSSKVEGFKRKIFLCDLARVYNESFFQLFDDEDRKNILNQTILVVRGVHKDPREGFIQFLDFYFEDYKKKLLSDKNLLRFFNWVQLNSNFQVFLKEAPEVDEEFANKIKEHLERLNDHTIQFDKYNELFRKAKLNFECKLQDKKTTDAFSSDNSERKKITFYSKNSLEERLPQHFSTGERTLICMFDFIMWLEVGQENISDKNAILFIDEFDAFLNPIQSAELIRNLNYLKTEIRIVLVSQKPTTIAQLSGDFSYFLASDKKIKESNQYEILKKLLKDTTDLSVYKSKQIYIFIEGYAEGIDSILYKKVLENIPGWKDKRTQVQFIPTGPREFIENIFQESLPKNFFGIVDNDGKGKIENEKIFTCSDYYSIENILFSPIVLYSCFEADRKHRYGETVEYTRILSDEYIRILSDLFVISTKEHNYNFEEEEEVKFIKLNSGDEDRVVTYKVLSFLVKKKIKFKTIKDFVKTWLRDRGVDVYSKSFMHWIIQNAKVIPLDLYEMFQKLLKKVTKGEY